MRAQLFEEALKQIRDLALQQTGDALTVDSTSAKRDEHSNDRTVLTKIGRLAEKVLDRG